MSKKLIQSITIIVSLLLSCSSFAAGDDQVRDGRQYVSLLTRRLNLPQSEMNKQFNNLRQNLPKHGDISGLGAAIDSLGRIAVAACEHFEFDDLGQSNITDLYKKFLDREPTASEKEAAILEKNGQFDTFANCFMLAMHPQMILIPRR